MKKRVTETDQPQGMTVQVRRGGTHFADPAAPEIDPSLADAELAAEEPAVQTVEPSPETTKEEIECLPEKE